MDLISGMIPQLRIAVIFVYCIIQFKCLDIRKNDSGPQKELNVPALNDLHSQPGIDSNLTINKILSEVHPWGMGCNAAACK